MVSPIRIAVLGSCVSRDLFNSRFNSDYKKFYECVLTQNQTSIISLMSNPIPYAPDPADGLSDYIQWNVRSDLSKEFLKLLKEKQPAYLLLDFFADIHFGCLQLNENQIVTDNRWMLHKTSLYKELKQSNKSRKLSIERDTEEYIDLWQRSVDQLFAFLSQEVPNCKVIVNKSRNVDSYLPKSGGKVQKLNKKINVAKLNQLWDRLDSYVCDHYDVYKLDQFHEGLVSFEEHPWGPFFVHYTMDYYHDCMNELHRIVLTDKLRASRDSIYPLMLESLRKKAFEKSKKIRAKDMALQNYASRQKELEGKVSKLSNESLTGVITRKFLRPLLHRA